MTKSVIVAFANLATAEKFTQSLRQKNYNIINTVTSGTDVLKLASLYPEGGIIVAGPKLNDVPTNSLLDDLPEEWELVIVSNMGLKNDNTLTLMLPLSRRDFFGTMDMLFKTKNLKQQPKQRTDEEKSIIEKAKFILMGRNGLTEDEAHRFIQKRSMNSGTNMVTIAKIICEEQGD